MSDKVKTLTKVIGVIICYLHSLKPLRLRYAQPPPLQVVEVKFVLTPYTGKAVESADLLTSLEG